MRFSRFSRVVAAAGIAALSAAGACADNLVLVGPVVDDAAQAVTVFNQLADSISRNGGDIDAGNAYASLAEAVRVGGRVSPVVITIDGVPTKFLATAQYTDIDISACPQVCAAASTHSTLRTLIAWQQDDPRRVVQLSSQADADPIRAYIYPVFAPFPGNSASLTFFDGKGGTYFGTSGTQKAAVTESTTPCTTAGTSRPTIAIFPAPPRCVQADFVFAFDGKAEPSSFLAKSNNATGTHMLSMTSQAVLGAAFYLSAIVPPLPPITVTPSASLPATLTAKVDSVVTFTLTVSNPSSTPATVTFNSGKHYDFSVLDGSGKMLWTWGMGMMFTQAVSSQTIPPNGTLVYTETWKPTVKGNLIATAMLTSVSHRAAAKVAFTVP